MIDMESRQKYSIADIFLEYVTLKDVFEPMSKFTHLIDNKLPRPKKGDPLYDPLFKCRKLMEKVIDVKMQLLVIQTLIQARDYLLATPAYGHRAYGDNITLVHTYSIIHKIHRTPVSLGRFSSWWTPRYLCFFSFVCGALLPVCSPQT